MEILFELNLCQSSEDKAICVQEEEVIYVNAKNQLVKITPTERNGQMTELHQILSFDVSKLPQHLQHYYTGEAEGES